MARLPATRALTAALLLAAALAGCGGSEPDADAGKTVVILWHGQKLQNEDALIAVGERFNASHPTIKLDLQRVADYTQLFQKIRATIQGGRLPELVIAYESMVAEFMEADVVLPLDAYLDNPDYGLSKEEQADIFPSFLNSNRYPEFGGQMLSFPFTKSLLMLYYNAEMLRAAGHAKPPETWTEFLQQCRDVKAKTGRAAFAYSRDASSFDGMVMSLGGKLAVDGGGRSNLDSPESVRALELLKTLVDEGLATVIALGSDEDRVLFSTQKAAFILRSSTTRAYMRKDIVDAQGRDRFEWSMACPPAGDGLPKLTVLYGGNICAFKTTPERQRAAWEFIKFFISPEITAEWSVKTGYLPVRRSAAETKVLQDFFAENPRNRMPFDTIPYGVREPSVAGWQAVREVVIKHLSRVLEGRATPQQAAADMGREADKILARR